MLLLTPTDVHYEQVGLHQTEVLQTHVAMLEQARSLVTTP